MGTTQSLLVLPDSDPVRRALDAAGETSQGIRSSAFADVYRIGEMFIVNPRTRSDRNIADLSDLAANLSQSHSALLLSVFDSDELLVACFENGRLADVLATEDCFGIPPIDEPVDRDCWSKVHRGVDRDILHAEIEQVDLFAERSARNVLSMFGITGYDLAAIDNLSPADAFATLALNDRPSTDAVARADSGSITDSDSESTEAWKPRCSVDLRLVNVSGGLREINAGGTESTICIVPSLQDPQPLLRTCRSYLESIADPDQVLKLQLRKKMAPDSLRVPKRTGKFKPGDLTAAKFAAVFEDLATVESLFLEATTTANERDFGIVIQQFCEDPDTNEGPYALHVALWHRSKNRRAAEARQTQLAVIDDFCREIEPLQGWNCNWDWVPMFSTVDESYQTPLEDVLEETPAMRAEDRMREEHCRRYLRGFGHTIWLGPELAGRVDMKACSAQRSGVGRALKLSFDRSTPLSTIETCIAPLLLYPSG